MTAPDRPLLDQRALRRAFNRASSTYAKAAALQSEVAERLIERLQWIQLSPRVVLDVGAAIGDTTRRLRQHYPEATVYALDCAEQLLQHASRPTICTESYQLPFVDDSVDLVFSNLSLHWSIDPVKSLQEYQRVLRPGGLLFFTTLGADTLKELQVSFQAVDTKVRVHPFGDMHDIGDLLLQGRWHDPVMDREHLTLHYASLPRLFQDLKETGTQNALVERPKGLLGKGAWQAMCDHYEAHYCRDGVFPATMELIYGHAWCPTPALSYTMPDEVVVPVSALKKR